MRWTMLLLLICILWLTLGTGPAPRVVVADTTVAYPIGSATSTATAERPTVAPVSPTVTPTPTATLTRTPTATVAHSATSTVATPTATTVLAEPTDPPQASATTAPTRTMTPTALPGTLPDVCEPNDTLVQPCALPTEIETTDLNFVDGTVDVYSFLLKAGRTYTIRASSTTGIDPVLTVYLAGDTNHALATSDDAAAGSVDAVVQVTTATDAWYLALVTNNAPGDQAGRTYTVSAISGAAHPATITAEATSGTALPTPDVISPFGDAYENNYRPEDAPRLSPDVPYDLSLICPEVGGCASGDHDFFLVPVKAGVPFVAVTYDLGPGTDPDMTLYSPAPDHRDLTTGIVGWQHYAANDDIAPGFTLRSQIPVVPPWSGYGLLVVASSTRADPPDLPAAVGPAGRYRLIIGSPDLPGVAAVLAAQSDIPPTPTPTATILPPTVVVPADPPAAPAPAPGPTAAPARSLACETSPTGLAVVAVDGTTMYGAVPPGATDALAVYDTGTEVRLLGQSCTGWAKVQPLDSVVAGWMFGPALRPAGVSSGEIAGTPAAAGTPLLAPSAGVGRSTTTAQPPAMALVPLTPVPTATRAPAAPVARAVTVTVCISAGANDRKTCATPVANLRVELVLAATDEILVAGTTDRAGTVTLSAPTTAGSLLRVQVPAVGVVVLLEPTTTSVPIILPPAPGGLTP